MKLFDREALFRMLTEAGGEDWVQKLRHQTSAAFETEKHGLLNQWVDAWSRLPPAAEGSIVDASGDAVTVTGAQVADVHSATQTLMQFHPWRKGPFRFHDISIDTEWRSDWKWNRIASRISLQGHRVLDVGCGNGYYGWRMLHQGAKFVCGLDPFLLYVMQYEAIRKYARSDQHNYVLPLGDDILPRQLKIFDTVFTMGVLYHRTSPVDHLQAMAGCLKTGGQLVLETLIIPGDDHEVLVPEGRYAKMRNVWFIPTVPMLQRWLRRTGFHQIKVVDVTPTTILEQRSTSWMTFESLADFLDPTDPSKTIEGYPGPRRAIVLATLRK
ncbi:MAG: tRNA 5-methoxyuridine(34)/uridine 5-oxyacetic acid(34) synthase CmoB [Planctomycetaceae bacterium]|nr:tRNA 5-methoxyuridine(34)/uridine 5-oxyacetic acid(34) synthase CmoB [Planctomycetaceae bacterium]